MGGSLWNQLLGTRYILCRMENQSHRLSPSNVSILCETEIMNRREWVVSMKSSWTTAERERVDRHDETLLSSSFSANEFSHEYVSAALMTEFITYRVEMYRTVRSWRTEVAAESVGRLPKRVRRRCFSEDAALDTKKRKWELRRSERWK